MSFQQWTLQPQHVFAAGKVVPVIVIDELETAVDMAHALLAGGIKVLEVTLRTPVAIDAIKLIREHVPEAIVGAGTVTNAEELAQVTAAGAQFAISPGLTDDLLDAAKAGSIPLIPGIATISELMQGIAKGYTHFKFFPAEASGGTQMLKSIAGPFPDIRFCPTGGIHQGNCADYLALANVDCVGGSWLLPKADVRAKNWQQVTALARAAGN